MAILKNGLFGAVNGKLGGAVMANWKGINTARAYTKPANPQTTGQTNQRSRFSASVEFAKVILTSVINIFWANKNAQMSPFNSFMKANVSLADTSGVITDNNLISTGSLEGASITAADYVVDDNLVGVTFSTSITSNGLATDKVLLVVYDKVNKVAFVSDGAVERSGGYVFVSVPGARTATNLIAFLAFYRGTAGAYETSLSVAQTCTDE